MANKKVASNAWRDYALGRSQPAKARERVEDPADWAESKTLDQLRAYLEAITAELVRRSAGGQSGVRVK